MMKRLSILYNDDSLHDVLVAPSTTLKGQENDRENL